MRKEVTISQMQSLYLAWQLSLITVELLHLRSGEVILKTSINILVQCRTSCSNRGIEPSLFWRRSQTRGHYRPRLEWSLTSLKGLNYFQLWVSSAYLCS